MYGLKSKSPLRAAVVLVGTLLFAAGCTGNYGLKQTGGALVGAGLGGLAGSQIGKGTGQLAAIGAGTLLGALLGSEVGLSLDRADQMYATQTANYGLETVPSGNTVDWNNPDSGHYGTFTPQSTYQTYNGAYCREYQQTVTVGGRVQRSYGTACRQPDGSWQVVN
jgi:surface antigen